MMHLLPENDELVWEVTSAGAQLPDGFDLKTWLDRLSRAVASGEIDIPELGLAVPCYPNSGHEPPVYENVTDLVLGHLLPHGHKPLLGLLDALERKYRQEAPATFLALLVIYADKISDLEGARAAFQGLETSTSASYAYIKAALQQLARERGGQAPKRKPAIWQHVRDKLAANPSMTASQIWRSIPEASPGDEEEKGIEVWAQRTQGHDEKRELYWLYRDVNEDANIDKLVQRRDADGTEQPIGFRAFAKYFTEARKNLSQDAQ
jgi:hypothetical protein